MDLYPKKIFTKQLRSKPFQRRLEVWQSATVSDGHSEHNYIITDDNWRQIKEGEWLLGVFHVNSTDSIELEKTWNVFAFKALQSNIHVGAIHAHNNPALQVRFLVTEFPKVFHIKDGIVRAFKKNNREEIVYILKDQKWDELELIDWWIHPFSTHISVFAYLCSSALHLHQYERSVIQEYFSSPKAADIAFALTFVIIGTIVGLIFSCMLECIKVFLLRRSVAKLCSYHESVEKDKIQDDAVEKDKKQDGVSVKEGEEDSSCTHEKKTSHDVRKRK